MAEENTSLQSVGVVGAQLKTKLSSLERAQIAGMKNAGSTISQRAGQIRGDVSGAVTRVSAKQKSAMELSANIASKLERSGAVGRVAAEVMGSTINSTVNENTPLTQRFPKLPVDISLVSNRLPDPYPKSPYERIKRKKESLVGESDLNYGGTTYPPDLIDQAPAYVELQFLKYTRSSPLEKGKIDSNIIIRLPIPENLNVYHSIRYEERESGPLGALLQSTTGSKIAENAVQELSKGFTDMNVSNFVSGVTGAGAKEDLLKVAGYAAASKLMESEPVLGGLAGQIAGVIPNPHPTVFFKGLDLREFQWTWKFVPRSESEASALDSVLRIMKQKVLPKNSGNFLDYPDLVQPRVRPDSGVWGKFKRAAIKNFSINFSGEGTSAFFVNGKPVSVICALTFQEVEGFYQEDP